VDVGLYHSSLSSENLFGWVEDEVQCSDVLSEAEKDYFFDNVCIGFDTEKYKKIIAEYAAAEIEDFFNDISDIVKIRRCGDTSINSPAYYNYRTDWLFFDAEIDEDEIQWIHDMVLSDADFFTWADRYKSCSGFTSSMPHTKSEYLRAINGKDIDRAVAMFLTYIGEKNGFLTDRNRINNYQANLEEKISVNNSYDDFITDAKCLEILERVRLAA
jgi:hypothetical protein